MTGIILYLAQVTAILLVAILVLRLMRRRSASQRHTVLTMALLGAMALPIFTSLSPWTWVIQTSEPAVRETAAWSVTPSNTSVPVIPSNTTSDSIAPSIPFANEPVDRIDPARVLIVLWALGSAMSFVFLTVGMVRLDRMARRAREFRHPTWAAAASELASECRLGRSIRVLESADPSVLLTWGVLRPTILVPQGAGHWPEDHVRVALAHEIAHIRRADWPIQILAELFRSAHWFNPLTWVLCRRLRTEAEQASDDAVLALGVSGGDYARSLVDLARNLRSPGRAVSLALAVAHHSDLERRVAVMLNSRISHHRITRAGVAGIAIVALLLILPIAGLRSSAQNDAPSSVTGVVVDQTGARIPEVAVSLESDAAPVLRVSDETGEYRLPPVFPGTYTLVAELPGFRTSRKQITIGGNEPLVEDIFLSVGSVATSVEVVVDPGAVQAVPAAPEDPRLRVSAGVLASRLLTRVAPVYPASLAAERVEGQVVLEGLIATDGVVQGIEIVSSPHPRLAIAAREAVRQWRYEPARLNGEPIAVATRITVDFHLRN
jgi:TonB family protein